jgi:hypothetical protein
MDRARLEDVELEGDLDAVQLGFVSLLEIDDVTLRLGQAYANIESINLRRK